MTPAPLRSLCGRAGLGTHGNQPLRWRSGLETGERSLEHLCHLLALRCEGRCWSRRRRVRITSQGSRGSLGPPTHQGAQGGKGTPEWNWGDRRVTVGHHRITSTAPLIPATSLGRMALSRFNTVMSGSLTFLFPSVPHLRSVRP